MGVERGGWGIDLGGLAHCWALRDQPVGWLLVASFGPRACDVCGWGLVGGVFDMWIVDASIWRQPVRLAGVFPGGWRGCCLLLFLLSVCETSCEGHMVDALASRADEGRWSLR